MVALTSCDRSGDSQAGPVTAGSEPRSGSTAGKVPMFDAKKVAPAPENPRVTQIAVGGSTSCAVLSDGSVWCWGSDAMGELGWAQPLTSNVPSRPVPTRVHGVSGAVAVAVSKGHVCAIVKDRSVRCWGSSGNDPRKGRPNRRVLAKPVAGLSDVAQLSVPGPRDGRPAGSLGCAVHSDGSVSCWLGLGAQEQAVTHQRGLGRVAELRIDSMSRKVCVRRKDGTVRCGRAMPKQVRHGRALAAGMVEIATGKARSIAVSSGRACAALETGELTCWKSTTGPKRADAGTNEARKVEGFDKVAEVALRGRFLCVRRSDDTLLCEKGRGKTPPVELTQIKQLSASWHACALTQAGKVLCWAGNRQGQLGDGSRIARSRPVALKW